MYKIRDVYVVGYKLLTLWFRVNVSMKLFAVSYLYVPYRHLWFHQQPPSVHVDQSSAVYQQRRSGQTSSSVGFSSVSL